MKERRSYFVTVLLAAITVPMLFGLTGCFFGEDHEGGGWWWRHEERHEGFEGEGRGERHEGFDGGRFEQGHEGGGHEGGGHER